MNYSNNRLFKFLFKSKKKFNKNKNLKNEIESYIKKSFVKNQQNLIKKYIDKLPISDAISNKVFIVNNLNKIMLEFENRKYLFLTNRISLESINKIYPGFRKNKKIIFYERIKNGKKLKNIIKNVKKSNNILVCIGGGKVSDLSKYISFKSGCLLITIPTILATHVYASKKIHILKPIKELGYNLTINGKSSDLSLIDLKIIKKNYLKNKRFFLSGMGDLMAFYNSKLDWQLSKEFKKNKFNFALKIILKVEKILEKINVKQPIEKWISEYIFAQVLLCDLTDWVGSDSASGSEHFFANIYEELYPKNVLHGELVAFGTLFFRYVRKSKIKKIISLLNKFKITNSLKRLKISKKKIILSLLLCKKEGQRKKRYSILEEIKFDKEFILNKFEEMTRKRIIKV